MKTLYDWCIENNREDLLKEWHPTKNAENTPHNIGYGSNKKVWWKCNKGHEWQASPNSRARGDSCPYCSNKKVLSGYNDLATTHPEIAKEWHPTKNSSIKPTMLTSGSNKKVWWKCKKGHEWEANVNNRARQNQGCPICSNKRVLQGYNDLATTHPEIAKEWHPTKNGDLNPTMVVAGSHQKVWWQCDKGHEWQAKIDNRIRQNQGCPVCSNRKLLKGVNDLQTLNPRVAKEWHPIKNGKLTPENVSINSTSKVWWQCDKGHEWQTSVINRTLMRQNCPKCSEEKRISFPEKAIFFYIKQCFPNAIENFKIPYTQNSELDIYIEELNLGIEYDGYYYHKNNMKDIKKYDICKNFGLQLLRIRELGCPQNDNIATQCFYVQGRKASDLNNAINCIFKFINENYGQNNIMDINVDRDTLKIYELIEIQEKENSLANRIPDLIKEWHPTKNGNLTPYNTAANSNIRVWWQCDKGHEWQAAVAWRYRGDKCPYCVNKKVLSGYNDLATTHPEIAKEWHPTKNGTLEPTDVIAGSEKKVWWLCDKGHEWQASLVNRTRQNQGCPFCSNRRVLQGYNDLATTHPEIAKEWHPTKNGELKPTMVTYGSKQKVWWQCDKGHEWETAISSRRNGGSCCPECHKKKKK